MGMKPASIRYSFTDLQPYMFSLWSWSQIYNYHVIGESRSYNYAQTNCQLSVAQTDPDQAYDRISGGRADDAYLVIEPFPETLDDPPASAMQSRLHDRFGSRGEGLRASRIIGRCTPLIAATTRRSESSPARRLLGRLPRRLRRWRSRPTSRSRGASFSYEREVAVTDGQFRVTVPYPGTYELEGASVDSVTVGEDAVQSGGEVAASG